MVYNKWKRKKIHCQLCKISNDLKFHIDVNDVCYDFPTYLPSDLPVCFVVTGEQAFTGTWTCACTCTWTCPMWAPLKCLANVLSMYLYVYNKSGLKTFVLNSKDKLFEKRRAINT